MIRTIVFVLFFCVGVVVCQAGEVPKGMFVWSLEEHPVLSSVGQIERMIAFAKKEGIRDIFVQVYRGNKSWFPSEAADDEPYRLCRKQVGQDAFALLIEKAHAQGIAVHAWMNMLSLGGNTDAPLLKKYGSSILTKNREPKRTLADYKIDNQYFLEPTDRRVIRTCVKLVDEVLSQYPALDGIQFDYIRYPDVHPFYGYSDDNIVRYKRAANKIRVVESDPAWKQWKRDSVTALLKRLVDEAKHINPKIHVSTTGCLSYGRALDEAMQDWPSWINTGLVEFVTLMNYPQDTATYINNIKGIKMHLQNLNRVNMAVGLYKNVQSPAVFKEHYAACLEGSPRSCVFFHYNNFLENPDLTM